MFILLCNFPFSFSPSAIHDKLIFNNLNSFIVILFTHTAPNLRPVIDSIAMFSIVQHDGKVSVVDFIG